jgi:hypothetical protein
VGYKGHPKNAGCELFNFSRVFGQLNAAAFAAAAGVDLRFYHNRESPQFRPDPLGFLNAEGRFPSRDRDSKLLEQFFGLILMNFHFFPRSTGTTS